MKKCPYCGKEYPDNATVCAIDREPLESDGSVPTPAPAPELVAEEPVEASVQSDEPLTDAALPDEFQPETIQPTEDMYSPDGFRCVGSFDPLEAARFLERFEKEGIKFQIDRIEKSALSGRGYRNMGLVEIYVHKDDDARAVKIIEEDYKV